MLIPFTIDHFPLLLHALAMEGESEEHELSALGGADLLSIYSAEQYIAIELISNFSVHLY